MEGFSGDGEFDLAVGSVTGYRWWQLVPHWEGPPGLPVAGVIEGTGRTLIGEHGFRCQRARIIALHLPFQPILNRIRGIRMPRSGSGDIRCAGVVLRHGAEGTWQALTGRDPEPEGPDARKTELATEEAALLRSAQLLAALMDGYPQAEVFATLPAMKLKYPAAGRPG